MGLCEQLEAVNINNNIEYTRSAALTDYRQGVFLGICRTLPEFQTFVRQCLFLGQTEANIHFENGALPLY